MLQILLAHISTIKGSILHDISRRLRYFILLLNFDPLIHNLYEKDVILKRYVFQMQM